MSVQTEDSRKRDREERRAALRAALTDPNRLLDEHGAAAYLHLTERQMQALRRDKRGPRHIRLSSRCLRFRVRDLDDWIAEKAAATG